jgi:hypothetical protein
VSTIHVYLKNGKPLKGIWLISPKKNS